ncbi:MAG: GWxTD domain-containing protein [Sphingobacteriaceae bacterium]|nr:GWxTD domain-containing protein [Sphingobacteriaceae bacterium]
MLNQDEESVEVKSVVYHLNDSISLLLVEVVNENLMYKRPDTSSAFYAEIKVSALLIPDYASRIVLDSSSIYLNDRAGEIIAPSSLKTMFTFKVQKGQNYYIDIKVLDLNKKIIYIKGQSVYKKENYGSQHYLVNVKKKPSFLHHFKEKDTLQIETKLQESKFVVDCFIKEFPPAFPPFSTKKSDEMKYVADSTFYLEKVDDKLEIIMPNKGFYHLRSNTLVNEGLSLFCFGNSYPGISTNEEMIKATRYIMGKDEYEKCLNAPDQKNAIDEFWVNIGGSKERAKELLKRYYNRVKEANKYYTSYCEGWKSDRGMLLIVLGKPNYIYKGKQSETWLYGLENNPNSFRYVFTKTNNPFSDNDYVLERSQFYKDHWYQAVDIWRQGQVYLNKN